MADPLNNKIFQDATKAREWLEDLLWAGGRSCGYCGTLEASTPLKGREGFYQCKACRKQFTVMVGTVFERSHIPLNKWLMAGFLLCASKKGISAHQIHRMLGITYKSAWFMCHRLREAMAAGNLPPLGGKGQTIEADETYIGNKEGVKKARSTHHKHAVYSLVERGGKARSFHVDRVTAVKLDEITRANVSLESTLNTDEALRYVKMGKAFAGGHGVVNHSESEYAHGDTTTNSVEGFFSIFKRGMKGVYQHCSEQHLHRYLSEFDFRYSNRAKLGVNDGERATEAFKGIVGKRLTYRRTDKFPEIPSLG